MVALSPADLPFRDAVRLDLRVLAFTAVVAVFAGTLAGLVPALRTRRGPMLVGERAEGMARSARASNALVAAQIAIAMVLVSISRWIASRRSPRSWTRAWRSRASTR